jgi:phage terminase large subunit-like protein
LNYIEEYHEKITNGSIIVGKWIRLLYDLVTARIESGEYIFDEKKADKAIRFIEKFCRHNKGKLAPQTIKLSLWEKAFLSLLYGIVDGSGRRQFTEVALFLGRKMGKTLIAAGITTYEAYIDGEFGSEIYFLAPKLDQADLAFSAFEFNKDKAPELAKITRKRKYDYIIDSSNSIIKKIAFADKKSDGYNPMLVICDEMSSWPAERGLKQYEVMKSGTGAREQPIILSISSGGYVSDGPYDELFKRGTRFLMGESSERRLLPLFYMIDDIQKWDDINELYKSLPGLGESVSVEFIQDEIATAHESLSKKVEFLTKYCNVKQNSSQAWLSAQDINLCIGEELKLEDFRKSYCVGGIDLSRTTDLTACCVLIERNGELYVFAHFFMPEGKLEEATERDQIPYRAYVQRGFLTLSGENFVQYQDVYKWFVEMVEKWQILPLQVGYDRYSSQYLVQDMTSYGFHMDDVYQGTNLSPVLRDMEGTIKDGRLHIGNNDLLKIHFLNSALKLDAESNKVKLIKMSPTAHIDGMAALSDAFCVRQKHYGTIGAQLANAGR